MTPPVKEIRILAVDDEPMMLKVIERQLGQLGQTLTAAVDDGHKALAILDCGQPIDLIICDLNMPGMDGIEMLRHLAAHNYAGDIILISGEDPAILQTAERLARAHGLNILGFTDKPIATSLLGDFIEAVGAEKAEAKKAPPDAVLSPADLRHAIDEQQLQVYVQPKVRTTDKHPVALEALVRWLHPERGVIAPAKFIPMAEEHGMIDALTALVFEQSLALLARYNQAGLDPKMAVNYSIYNLSDLNLPNRMLAQLAEHKIAPSRLMLEVTESQLMEDVRNPLEVLTRLRLKGVGVSIDDFGTGFSSLEQLQRLPCTELKVDRAFVYQAHCDSSARAIFEASVTLARKLNLSVVAEGVEDQEDWDLCTEFGVDLVQGYFISRPMPGPDFIDWAKQVGS